MYILLISAYFILTNFYQIISSKYGLSKYLKQIADLSKLNPLKTICLFWISSLRYWIWYRNTQYGIPPRNWNKSPKWTDNADITNKISSIVSEVELYTYTSLWLLSILCFFLLFNSQMIVLRFLNLLFSSTTRITDSENETNANRIWR